LNVVCLCFCKRKCVEMAITGVSLSAVNPIRFEKKNEKMDKKAEPVAVQPKVTADSGEALRSYFAAGQAISFGFHCSTGKFVTKRMDDVPCCCCGGKMILQRNLDSKAYSFASLTGTDLADKIEKERDYFRNNQGTIAGMIAREAKKDNGLDAEGAVREISGNFYTKLKTYCTDVLNETDKIAKSAMGEKNPVSQLIQKEKLNVAGGAIDRIPFTEKLVALNEAGEIDPSTYDKVLNTAMLLPQNAGLAAKQFNRIQGRDNEGIFIELLRESTQTIEHVHPHSLGGPNDTDNYLAECGECNHQRGNMSYLKWIKVHPEYPINAQKHIEWFQQKVVDGDIDSRYDDYGSKIRQTLSKESNGKMVLKVLDKDKIREFRLRALNGLDADVHEEIEKQQEEEKLAEKAKQAA